jgi:hypothetical protein
MKKKGSMSLEDHHILPDSRNGKYNQKNIKRVPSKYHRAFHLVFLNLTPEERIEYLKQMWDKTTQFISPDSWLKLKT